MTTLLVTGGTGFIGGNFVRQAVAYGLRVVNLDALTCAGNLDTLANHRMRAEPLVKNGDGQYLLTLLEHGRAR